MCRLAFIPQGIEDYEMLNNLFTVLNKSNGGDGLGIGWFDNGNANVFKGEKLKPEDIVTKMKEIGSDKDFLFHCRMASVGSINDSNCHPFVNGNMITVHNGHIGGIGILKLMMLENIEKYPTLTKERIMSTTDSDILSHFISKMGFDVVPMMDCGTVLTMYKDGGIDVFNGTSLEAVNTQEGWVFASEIPPHMGLYSKDWVVFSNGSRVQITPDGSCKFISGYCVDGKALYQEKMKKRKNKGKYIDIDSVEVA